MRRQGVGSQLVRKDSEEMGNDGKKVMTISLEPMRQSMAKCGHREPEKSGNQKIKQKIRALSQK